MVSAAHTPPQEELLLHQKLLRAVFEPVAGRDVPEECRQNLSLSNFFRSGLAVISQRRDRKSE
jgi:hypothetical protein